MMFLSMIVVIAMMVLSLANGVFVAGGGAPNAILVSSSGRAGAWVGRGTSILTEARCACYSGGQSRWLVGGTGPTFKLAQSRNSGLSWTGVSLPFNLNTAFGCAWSPQLGRFAVAGHGASHISTSKDLVTWDTTGSTVVSGFGWAVAWGGTGADAKFIVVGTACATPCAGQNSIAHSFDGINWVGQGLTHFSIGRGVAWSASTSTWVAVGKNAGGAQVIRSLDGITWTSSGAVFPDGGTPGAGEALSVVRTQSRWIVGGSCCSTMWSSVDASLGSWVQVDPNRLVHNVGTRGLAYSPELGVVVASGSSSSTLASSRDDGRVWEIADKGSLMGAGFGAAWGREDACGDLPSCVCETDGTCTSTTSITLSSPGAAIGVGTGALAITGSLTLTGNSAVVVNAVNSPQNTLISATGNVAVMGNLEVFVNSSTSVQVLSGAAITGSFSPSSITAVSLNPCEIISSVVPSSTATSLSLAITTTTVAGCVPPAQPGTPAGIPPAAIPPADSSSDRNIILGSVVGAVLGLALIAAIIGVMAHVRKRNRSMARVRETLEGQGGSPSPYQSM